MKKKYRTSKRGSGASPEGVRKRLIALILFVTMLLAAASAGAVSAFAADAASGEEVAAAEDESDVESVSTAEDGLYSSNGNALTEEAGDVPDHVQGHGYPEVPEDGVSEISGDSIWEMPEDSISEAPEDNTSKTQENGISEALEESFPKLPEDGGSEAPENGVTKASEESISKTQESASSEASEDGLSKASEDGLSEAPEDGLSEVSKTGASEIPEEAGAIPESEESEPFGAGTGGASAGPVIALDYVPPYGEFCPLQGQIYMGDGSGFDPSNYRISLFIQIAEGERCWVKPYDTKPYASISPDGSFGGVFISGGTDENARIIHVMLIPSTYTPTSDSDSFEKTRAVAVDYVKVTRTPEGGVAVDPCRPMRPPVIPPAPAISALLPVKQDKIAVDVGFYTDGSSPGSPLSEKQIRKHLNLVSEFSDVVRFYNAGGEINKAYQIAHDMGFSIVGTAYLSGSSSGDRAEMDALIDLCNRGLVQVACVGNETLLDTGNGPTLTAQELVADIQYVRDGIEDKSIPVTTSDSVDILLESPYVRNSCNLIMPNCYPFWGGVEISEAPQSFIRSITALQTVSRDKQVLVSETGWPTAGNEGSSYAAAVAGEEQAVQYYEAVREWSLSTGTQILYFDSADEPWKTNEAGFGPHWGFMTKDLELKDQYAECESFPVKHPQEITLKPTAARIAVGKSVQISVTGNKGKLSFESSDPSVAVVNRTTGKVTAKKVGTAKITVTADETAKYKAATKYATIKVVPGATGSLTAENTSAGVKLKWKSVKGATGYLLYKGSTVAATIKSGSTVAYTDKKAKTNGQKYSYKIVATASTGNSTLSKSVSTYYLAAPAITSLKNSAAGKATVKWGRNDKSSGYELEYALKPDFSGAKAVKIDKAATVSRVISGLKKGKNCYVRIRAFKKSGSSTWRSAWSAAKKIKIAK